MGGSRIFSRRWRDVKHLRAPRTSSQRDVKCSAPFDVPVHAEHVLRVYTAMLPMNAKLRRTQEFAKPVEIESDVWVGGDTTMPRRAVPALVDANRSRRDWPRDRAPYDRTPG